MKVFGVRKRFYFPILAILITAYVIAAVSPNVEATQVYKVLPVFILYTDTEAFYGEGNAATCRGPLVIISNDYRNDKDARQHELVHARQVYRYFLFHWILCYFSDDQLAKAEAEAYGRIDMARETDAYIYAELIRDEYTPNVDIKQIEGYLAYYWRLEHVHTN